MCQLSGDMFVTGTTMLQFIAVEMLPIVAFLAKLTNCKVQGPCSKVNSCYSGIQYNTSKGDETRAMQLFNMSLE
jgi:hypothetical protein